MKSSVIFQTKSQILLGTSKLRGCCSRGMWHAWEKSEMCRYYLWGNLKGKGNLEYIEYDVKVILTFMLKK
jgi:hypothetical protein